MKHNIMAVCMGLVASEYTVVRDSAVFRVCASLTDKLVYFKQPQNL